MSVCCIKRQAYFIGLFTLYFMIYHSLPQIKLLHTKFSDKNKQNKWIFIYSNDSSQPWHIVVGIKASFTGIWIPPGSIIALYTIQHDGTEQWRRVNGFVHSCCLQYMHGKLVVCIQMLLARCQWSYVCGAGTGKTQIPADTNKDAQRADQRACHICSPCGSVFPNLIRWAAFMFTVNHRLLCEGQILLPSWRKQPDERTFSCCFSNSSNYMHNFLNIFMC